jgi:hypothetical protein
MTLTLVGCTEIDTAVVMCSEFAYGVSSGAEEFFLADNE